MACVLLAASLLAFLLSSHLRRLIAEPISRLVSATTSVSKTGDYGVRAQKLSGDEMGVLVDRFNEMLAGIQSRDSELKKALADREAALQEAEDERRTISFHGRIDAAKDLHGHAHRRSRIYFNKQWMDFTGLTFDQIRELGLGRNSFIPTISRKISAPGGRASLTGEPLLLSTAFAAPMANTAGISAGLTPCGTRGAIFHVDRHRARIFTSRKRSEEELRRANDDLQQFAYSASHDLQEPIRNVAVYSEIDGPAYHDRAGCRRTAVLGFPNGGRPAPGDADQRPARLYPGRRGGSSRRRRGPVGGSGARAFQPRGSDARKRCAVTHDPLPQVDIGEAHLQQLFQNLIGNALKYRDTSCPPDPHLGRRRKALIWCFSVQDNGIGIDPQYKEKIFGVFKRLHRDQKYSGTGIGLAICQRVVERYGADALTGIVLQTNWPRL